MRITFTHQHDVREAETALREHDFQPDCGGACEVWRHVVSVEASTPERSRLAKLLGARHGGTVEHGGATRGSTLPPEYLSAAAVADRVFFTFEHTPAQERTITELREHDFNPVSWDDDGAPAMRYLVILPDPETPERHRLALHLCHEHNGTYERPGF